MEVGVDDRGPLLGTHFVEHRIAGDPGIVDQDVDRPEVALDLLEAGDAGVVGRNVPLLDRDAGLALELLRRLVIAALVGRDRMAGRAKRLRNRRANAARTAGDHCHAGHAFLPVVRTTEDGRRASMSVVRLGFLRPYLSIHIAMPMPPPMHSVARPFFALRFCISWSSVTSTPAPAARVGCPG